jgi:hypothetical protein
MGFGSAQRWFPHLKSEMWGTRLPLVAQDDGIVWGMTAFLLLMDFYGDFGSCWDNDF